MTAPVVTAAQRQRHAIVKARARREHELAPLRAEVGRLVAEVGWERARPIVEAVMAPVRVSGPRGVWRSRVGKRTGRRILAELAALPVQEHLDFAAQPARSLASERRSP
jgi:hypothetical protein